MVEQGVVSEEEDDELAAAEPAPDARGRSTLPRRTRVSPYFTTWLRQQVVDHYGAGEAFGGGLQIKSTLDLEFQEAVEEARSRAASRRSSRPARWS